jgi:hypothetical protein
MLTKIYFGLWIATFAAALLMFATGSFTMMTVVVFGFIAFGLTFMGMMSVLPSIVSHPTAKQYEDSLPPDVVPERRTLADRVGSYTAALTHKHP